MDEIEKSEHKSRQYLYQQTRGGCFVSGKQKNEIMAAIFRGGSVEQIESGPLKRAGLRPNDRCPCGSGKKVKKCHCIDEIGGR